MAANEPVLLETESPLGAPSSAARPQSRASDERDSVSLRERVIGLAFEDGRTLGAELTLFLETADWLGNLVRWFGTSNVISGGRRSILQALDRDIAWIDELLTNQVNAILHHSRFRQMEASWRGVWYLVAAADDIARAKIRILNVSWSEICRDLERAIEFDQSQLFAKIYSEEFGMPGGEPFGIIIADYAILHKRQRGHPTDDVAALQSLGGVAAAAFSPIILGADPGLLGLDGFATLGLPVALDQAFRSAEYARWRSLQDMEDARFLALALPRVLMRLPYYDQPHRLDGFRFREHAEDPDSEGYLWGSSAYAFAGIVIRAFGRSGWFADLRGAHRDENGGGLVTDLLVDSFTTDRPGIAVRGPLEVALSDNQEREIGELGLIALSRTWNTPFAVFYGNPSLQTPKNYDRSPATANARLSSMMQYILCVSRFAHYVKVMARDRIGAFSTPEDCQDMLQKWLLGFCSANEKVSPEERARYPLRRGQVQVREHPARPGSYMCTVHLQPHFQIDQVVSTFRLITELAPPAAA